MSTEIATVEERVAAGVAWLDEKHPGWVKKINLDEFDIDLCLNCILGQLFGGFHKYDSLGLDMHQAVAFGFDIYVFQDDWPTNYGELQAEWERVIKERQQ